MASDERTEEKSGDERTGEKSGDGEKIGLDRDDETQSFVDQSKIDFDPDDGIYSGTAVDGTSEIAGPHANTGDGQLDEEQMREQAQKEAEEAGVDPEDTPANKSPVAKAAEQEAQGEKSGAGESDEDQDEDDDDDK